MRGVWLDRGELDKIIERSMTFDNRPRQDSREHPSSAPRHDDAHRSRDDYDSDDYRKGDDYAHGGKRNRRKSFLGDLFDFD